MMTLAEYLRSEGNRPFEFGTSDCVTLIADWVRLRRGFDPIIHYRGYSGRVEAHNILDGYGGLIRVVARVARCAGVPMTNEPRPGDIAVVVVDGVTACAIRGETRWAMRPYSGGLALLSLDEVRVIAAWRV
jgi:hypothetical protein